MLIELGLVLSAATWKTRLAIRKCLLPSAALERDSLLLKATLRFPNGNDERVVRLRNLSAGGVMADAPTGLLRGERVKINLHSIGRVGGHVMWVTDGRAGIAFDLPINPQDARRPIGVKEFDIPFHLKRLNIRRV